MKTLKILMALVLSLSMLLCLAACGGGEETPEVTTTVPVETTEEVDPNPVYTIKVVDENGEPIKDVWVQICLESCYPGVTNEEGIAKFSVVEADYKVQFTMIPEGYENQSGEDTFYFEEGSMEMELTLTSVTAE